MSERRSSRSRNTVKYSGFDDESDDDFANVSSHPAKKPKTSQAADAVSKVSKKSSKDNCWDIDAEIVDSGPLKSSKSANPLNEVSSSKTRRAPLSEKVYKRELQEALELSMLETGGSQDVLDHDKGLCGELQAEPLMFVSGLGGSNIQQFSESATIHTELKPHKSPQKSGPSVGHIPGTVVLDDSIELLEESGPKQQGRQQRSRPAAKIPKVADSDEDDSDESDFAADSGSDEDSDYTSADMPDKDEDKRSGLKMKINLTKSKVNSAAANTKTSLKSVNKGTANPPKKELETASRLNSDKPSPSAHSSKSSSKSSLSSHSSPKTPGNLVSQWKPPSKASANEASLFTARSPSSGLRLGLSRNQRVKPLHPSVGVV